MIFGQIKDVNVDGLQVVGSLATCMNENFDRYFDDFWKYL